MKQNRLPGEPRTSTTTARDFQSYLTQVEKLKASLLDPNRLRDYHNSVVTKHLMPTTTLQAGMSIISSRMREPSPLASISAKEVSLTLLNTMLLITNLRFASALVKYASRGTNFAVKQTEVVLKPFLSAKGTNRLFTNFRLISGLKDTFTSTAKALRQIAILKKHLEHIQSVDDSEAKDLLTQWLLVQLTGALTPSQIAGRFPIVSKYVDDPLIAYFIMITVPKEKLKTMSIKFKDQTSLTANFYEALKVWMLDTLKLSISADLELLLEAIGSVNTETLPERDSIRHGNARNVFKQFLWPTIYERNLNAAKWAKMDADQVNAHFAQEDDDDLDIKAITHSDVSGLIASVVKEVDNVDDND